MQTLYQPSFLDLLKPDVDLDSDIIIIGNPDTSTNLSFFESFLEDFKKTDIFALDTETFGKESWEALYFNNNYVRLLQIGLPDGRVLIIDFGGWEQEENWANIRHIKQIQEILPVLSEKSFDNEVAILGVNLGGFDFPVIRKHFNIICRQARDLMILSRVVWPGVGSYKAGGSSLCALSHGLKGIAGRLGEEVDKTEQTSAWGWSLSNSQFNYAAKDVRVLFPLFTKLRNEIKSNGLTYTAWVESRAVAVFANMEYHGFPIDVTVAESLLSKYRGLLAANIQIFEEAYPNVLWGSNDQLLACLQEKYPELDNVQKETLQALDYTPTNAIIEARNQLKKIRSIEAILNNTFNGSIHTKFNQIGPAATGRTTSYSKIKGHEIGLQLQNVDREIRSIFRPTKPNQGLGIYDGSGMHQRIATQCSNDPNLLAGYEKGLDLHSVFAADLARILGEDSCFWEYDYIKQNKDKKPAKTYRDLAKKIFYSCLNGSGKGKILMGMHMLGFAHADEEHAAQAQNIYNNLYQKLLKFIKTNHKKASSIKIKFDFKDPKFTAMNFNKKVYGKVTALTGRIQYLEHEPGRYGTQVSYTAATASTWLMTEADLLKHWMAEVQDKFWETPEWEADIINMVHDEINFVYNKDYQDEIAKFVADKMNEIFSTIITVIPALENKMYKNPACGMAEAWSDK